MTKEVISTETAPKAIGPYSQAIRVGSYLFLSGQLPIDPNTGAITGDDINSQTRQVLENIKSILTCVRSSMKDIVKTTIFLKDINDFSSVNEVYQEYFDIDAPARSCVEVSRIPKDALVEIESIAVVKG